MVMGSLRACMARRVVIVTFFLWAPPGAIGLWEELRHCWRVVNRGAMAREIWKRDVELLLQLVGELWMDIVMAVDEKRAV